VRLGGEEVGAGELALWDAVDRLVEPLSQSEALAHQVAPLAARRMRALGRNVPKLLALEERAATLSTVVAQSLLARIRSAVDGPIVVFKGPEIAAHYPGRARRFADIDLLVPDADGVHAKLLAVGFRPVSREFPSPDHHLHPIEWPGTGMPIEIHRRFKWPRQLTPPGNDEIFDATIPSALDVDGIQTLPPRQQALMLVAHAWDLLPLRTLRAVIDIAAAAQGENRRVIDDLASAWGLQQPWRTTCAVIDWLFAGGERPLAARIWARHLKPPRDRTVTELHLAEWLSPLWVLPPRTAVRGVAAAVARDLRPHPGQTRERKLRQIVRALSHPLSGASEHRRRSERDEWLGSGTAPTGSANSAAAMSAARRGRRAASTRGIRDRGRPRRE
jgi:hypothetical protein